MDIGRVPFRVTENRSAKGSQEINVRKDQIGKVRRILGAYAEVELSDGTRGNTALRVLELGTGWPYVALQGWDPAKQIRDSKNPKEEEVKMKGSIRIRHGDEGKIVGYSPDLKWVKVTIPLRKVQGSVPREVIQPGNGRRYGDVALKKENAFDTAEVASEISTQASASRTKTGRAIKALLTGMAKNKEKLGLVKPEFYRFYEDELAREATTNTIVGGIRTAGVLDDFENDHCSLEQLLQKASEATGSPLAGVYLRMYTAFARLKRDTAVYTGSAVVFGKRMSSYVSNPPSGIHGNVYGDAATKHNRIICVLSDADYDLILLAEQLLMILLGTYIPSFMSKNELTPPVGEVRPTDPPGLAEAVSAHVAPQHGVSREEEQWIDDVELDEEDLDAGDENQPASDGKVVKFSVMKQAAIQLLAVARVTLADVPWVPMTQRSSFGGQYGTCAGLNIQSPVSSCIAMVVYTRMRIPGENMTVYRRGPLTSNSTGKVGHVPGRGGAGFSFLVSAKFRPAPGTKVLLVFEVTTDGRRHQRSWARLPKICAYTDAQRAGTLAVRAECMNAQGVWQSQWLQAGHVPARYSDDMPGSIGAIGIAIGILNVLQRRAIADQSVRPFDRPMSRARHVDLSFDNLTQTLTIKEDTRPYEIVHTGVLKNADTLLREMRDAQLENVGEEFEYGGEKGGALAKKERPSEQTGRGGPGRSRKTCDMCYLMDFPRRVLNDKKKRHLANFTMETRRSCVQIGEKNLCETCKSYGLPSCSWTPADILQASLEMHIALWFPAPVTEGAVYIPDPELQQGGLASTPGQGGGGDQASSRRASGSSSHGSSSGHSRQSSNASSHGGAMMPAQTLNPASYFDLDYINERHSRGTLAAYTDAFTMITAQARRYPDLATNVGAQARHEAARLLKVLRQAVANAGDPNAPALQGHRVLIGGLEKLERDLGKQFALKSFTDERGTMVRNRMPKISEVAKFAKSGQIKGSDITALAQYLTWLARVLGENPEPYQVSFRVDENSLSNNSSRESTKSRVVTPVRPPTTATLSANHLIDNSFEYFPPSSIQPDLLHSITLPPVSAPAIQHIPPWWDMAPPVAATPNINVHRTIETQPHNDARRFPLRDEQEVRLMQCYSNELARRFDHLDSTSSFGNKIPELAIGSPVLLNAILASAAVQLSVKGEMEEDVAGRYQTAALAMLLPSFQLGVFEPDRLTAAVLLRHTLMRAESCDGAYLLNALPGLDVYFAVWHANAQSTLHAALSIGVLRMSIYACWNDGTIAAVEADCSWMTGCYYPDTTDFWNCKITMLCARTINYCHDQQAKTEERWMVLDALADDWSIRKPRCFEPIFEQAPNGDECFPKLVFAGDLHGTITHKNRSRLVH
ncbi:hypothetical protein LTR17_011616 [Elasticomyces elasticus]|nr:hypothetical protein LTR17_011616 [Elasticomyces elasticus]